MYYYLIRAIDNRNKLLCWDIGLLTIFCVNIVAWKSIICNFEIQIKKIYYDCKLLVVRNKYKLRRRSIYAKRKKNT